ncbi:MAG TPA: GNAT family N-acetyltransferase [Jatrophihabitans sp.]|nr:GNAT family N-acetyltransferase [Jatrophihabitans sp.]
MPAELRWLTASDAGAVEAIIAAGELFDNPVAADQAREFLSRDGHHLCIGYLAGEPVGFVSGVELNHPDKGSEMLLYELGVDPRRRGRGIGRQLVLALVELARERGCYGIWTLTELDNEAAIASYRSAGLSSRGSYLMLDHEFG